MEIIGIQKKHQNMNKAFLKPLKQKFENMFIDSFIKSFKSSNRKNITFNH